MTTCPAVIDNTPVRIPNDLFGALYALSSLPGSPCLWVDALCINQCDGEERRKQSLLMHRIYSVADHVMIWLGPPTDGALEALQTLSQLGWELWSLRKDEQQSIDFSSETRAHALSIRLLEDIDDAAWGLIRKLFQRPWWRRVWVIQEVVLAKEASVCCGNLAVAWTNILEVIQLCSLLILSKNPRLGNRAREIAFTVGHFNLIDRQHLESRENDHPGLTLEELLSFTLYIKPGTMQATDSRDRVFGLLPLLRDEDREAIVVDYSDATTPASV
jgi:hypothetical protein